MRSAPSSSWRVAAVLVMVIAIVFVIVQAIARPVSGTTTTYRADFHDAFGLRPNADVRIRGTQIGKIKSISLADGVRARVTFTMLDAHPLRTGDRISIRFQNLTGQRYLEIVPGAVTAPKVSPDEPVSADKTVSSLDITAMFNGLQPVLRQADPAVYNRLAVNLVALLEGENHDGVGSIMKDVGTLAGFAQDRSEVFELLIKNFGDVAKQLYGNSKTVDTMLGLFGGIFHTLSSQLEQLLALVGQAAAEFSGIDRMMQSLKILTLGGADALTKRVYELIPEPTAAVKALSAIPPMIDVLTRAIPNTTADLRCSKGNATLPGLAQILLAGQAVVLCKQ